VPALRGISSDLAVPESVRARILLEMAADLESLYEHFRATGIGEEEAARLTEERILATPEALNQLVLVHTTAYQRWVARASEGLRWGFDVALLTLGVVPMLLIGSWIVGAEAGAMLGAPLLWPLLGVGVFTVIAATWKAWQLFIRRPAVVADLNRGIAALLAAAVAGPAIGALASLVQIHRLSLDLMSAGTGSDGMLVAAEGIAESAALLGAGLLVGIGAGLTWFVLVNRVATIERAESAALLAG
jgi:hypothetical protein